MGDLIERFGLPVNYQARWPVTYYDDATEAVRLQTWQGAVYAAAARALTLLEAPRLIDIGCGSGEKTVRAGGANAIGLEFGANLPGVRARFPFGDWREHDAESDDTLPVTQDELAGAVLICADVIEHLRDPTRVLRATLNALPAAGLAILSTPDRALTIGSGDPGPPRNEAHVREWTAFELTQLLRGVGFQEGIVTWTAAHDLTDTPTSITCFLAARPESLERLRLVPAPIKGFVLAPAAAQPGLLKRCAREAQRQSRRIRLRFIGKR